jgi:putative flippase GtrA
VPPPHADKLRFLLAGGATTLATYALYWILLRAGVDPRPAYAIAYVAGIALSYALNVRWVFGRRWTRLGLASFALSYGLQAVLSYGLFLALLAWTPVPVWLAPVAVTVVLLPLTFLVNRTLVHRTSPDPARGAG